MNIEQDHARSASVEKTIEAIIEASRVEDRQFLEIFEALPVAIYTTDANGAVTHYNRAAVEFIGTVPEIGKDRWCIATRLYWPDGTPCPRERCPMAIALLEKRAVRGKELIVERLDGTRVPVLPHPTPIFDEQGELVGGVNLLVDLTDIKGAEARASESERRLHQALESAKAGAWGLEVSTGAMSWSSEIYVLFGFDEDRSPTYDSWIAAIHPADRARVRKDFGDRLASADSEFRQEYRISHPVRGLCWMLTMGSITRDEFGLAVRVDGINLDITERKQAEAALRAKEAELRLVARTTPVRLTRCSRDLRYLFANHAAAALFGFTPDQIVGRKIVDVMGEAVFEKIRPYVERVLDGESIEYEAELEYPAVGVRWVRVNYLPEFDDNDEVKGWIASVIDITERKRAEQTLEQQLRQLETIYKLSSAVSRASRLDEIIETALDGLCFSVGADRASVLLFDPDGVMRFKGWRGLSDAYRAAVEGHTPWKQDDADARPILVSNVDEDASLATFRDTIVGEGIRALAFVPMVSGERVLGKFMVYFDEPHAFTEQEVQVCQTLAGHVAHSIEMTLSAEALRESEERFRLATSAGTVGVWDWDIVADSVNWSDAVYTIHGLKPGEFGGKVGDFAKCVHPDDREFVERSIERTLKEDAPYDIEFRVVHPDGKVAWVYTHATVVRDATGAPVRMLGGTLDITEIKRTEVALRESETRFSTLAHNAPTAIFVKDLDGRYTHANPLACDALGCPHGVVGKTDHEMLPRHVADALRANDMEVVRSGRSLEREEVLERDGDLREFLSVKFPMLDPEGKVTGVCGVAVDITDRKRSERALAESEDRYRLVVAGADAAIWDWDVAHKRVVYSPRWKELRGLSDEEVTDSEEEWSSRIHPDDLDRVLTSLQRHFAGETPHFSEEYRVKHKDGTWKWILDRGVALKNEEGVVVRMAGSETDITDRKLAEIALLEREAEARDLSERLRLLLESTSKLIETLDTTDLLPSLLGLARKVIAADAFGVWRMDEDENWSVVANSGLSDEFIRESLKGSRFAALPEDPVVVQPCDLTEHTTPLLKDRWGRYEREGIKSLMILPLRIHGEVSGTLVFYCRTPHVFSGIEVESARAMANIAASALTTAELYEAQERMRRRAEDDAVRESFLSDAGAILARSLDYEETLANVARAAVPRFADWCAVDLLDEQGDLQRLAIAHVDPSKIELAQALHQKYPPNKQAERGAYHVIRTGEPEMMEEIPDELLLQACVDEEHLRMARELKLTSYIAVPLTVRNRAVGVITYVTADSDRRFCEADLRVATAIARRAADAIENACLYDDLKASEARFRNMANVTPAIIWTAAPGGTLTWTSDRWFDYTGAPRDERASSWQQVLHPDDISRCREAWERALAQGSDYEVECRMRRHDGSYRWFVTRATPVLDDEGGIVSWFGSTTDINDAKETQRALESSEARFRTIFSAAGVSVWELDFADVKKEFDDLRAKGVTDLRSLINSDQEFAARIQGLVRVADMNDETLRMFGAGSRDEVLEHLAATVTQERKRVFVEELVCLFEGRHEFRVEMPFTKLDGTPLPVFVTVRFPEEGGDFRRVVATLTDVTELKDFEEKLRQREEEFRAIFERSSVGKALLKIPSGRIRRVNDSLCSLVGRSQHALRMVRLPDLVHPLDRARFEEHFASLVEGDRDGFKIEVRLAGQDDRVTWALASVGVLRHKLGQPQDALVTLLDVTDSKLAQEGLVEQAQTLATLNRVGAMLSAETDLQRLLQALTDAGTELTGAQFGAYYGTVMAEDGGALRLHSVCGAPREDFESLGVSLDTPLFAQAFAGQGVARCDDAAADPRWESGPALTGVSEGRLPIRSCLAIPVFSRSGEVLGGLFFGHPEVGAFTEQSERLVVGIAAQAAVAIDNAKLVEALSKSESQLRLVTDAMPVLISYVDRDERYQFNTKSYEAWFGLRRDEVIGRTLTEVLGAEVRSKLDPHVRRVLAGQRVSFEDMLPYKHGPARHVAVNYVPDLGTEGQVRGFFAMVEDVSARVTVERAAKQSYQQLRQACEAAEMGSWRVDLSTRTSTRDPLFNRILGLEGVETTQPMDEMFRLVHPDDRAAVEQLWEEIGPQHEVYDVEFRIVRNDGSVRWLREFGRFMPGDDREPPSVTGLALDITMRRELELERVRASKLESIGVLAGGIAHDFNNILTGILGNVSLARAGLDSDGEAAQRILAAEKACLRAQKLTQQLLTFSRGGAPVKGPVMLQEVIEESASFVLQGSKVGYVEDVEPGLPPVEADAGQIGQVVQNLVLNAAQSMPEGGTIRLKARAVEFKEGRQPLPPGRYVEVAVSDQGAGIPAGNLLRIFDPFFSTRSNGSGLGLATTLSILQRHGGHLEVESEVGTGSTFRFYLPVSDALVYGPLEAARLDARGTGRILVMDDEPAVREVALLGLSGHGYDVTTVSGGTEAVKAYASAQGRGEPFDAVVLDLTIKGDLGGTETLARLLEIDPDVKAIVASGYSHDPVLAKYREFGFAGMIAKPYRAADLAAEIASVLSCAREASQPGSPCLQ